MENVQNSTTSDNALKQLQRALYYETQYRTAIVSNAKSFYDANITKDLIEGDFFYKDDESGTLVSIPDLLGLKLPCKFSDFINTWAERMIPKTSMASLPDLTHLNEFLIDLYNSGRRDYNVGYWSENANGKRTFLNQLFLLTKNEAGDICALSIVKDFTNHRKIEDEIIQKELEQYAYFDPITNGYNYIKFKERLNAKAVPGSIVCLDIHAFKIINSICGITKGDLVIRKIWENIIAIIDIDQGDLAAHINADHYIIFIPTTDEAVITRKIKNISLAISLIPADLKIPQISPYFGVSTWEMGKRIELAYSEAVAAKHNAKDQQNCNYAFFNEEDTVRLIEEKVMTDSFEDALAKKEFKLWFQPKYNPITQKPVGAEALVRWINNSGKIVSPGVFIPLFEKNSMIRVLDEYIFRNLCQTLKSWQTEGRTIVPVSVNLSRASLYYKDVVTKYTQIIENIGLEKKYVPIEITESAAITNNQVKEIADKFYQAGFSLHMDDFGSGYSSLASLNMMHFDTLKLDKSLIDFIGNFGGDRLIEHTICLAKELGMHVTAEGVEKEHQVTFLKHIGCDSIQGYFYSKPLPKNEFEDILKTLNDESIHTEADEISQHISDFNQSFLKSTLYTFTVNLSKDTFIEYSHNEKWADETKIASSVYSEAVNSLANNYILPEYKIAYLNFMNRERLLENFCGMEETRILTYERIIDGEAERLMMMYHLFKVNSCDDIMAYISVSKR